MEPLDDEAHHLLIEALADTGNRADALRHFESYARQLELETLRPLEQTVELVERIRARQPDRAAAGLPTVRLSAEGPAAVVGGSGPRQPGWRMPAGGPVGRRGRQALAASAVLALGSVAFWASGPRQTDPLPTLSPAAVAVLPFGVRGGEDAHYLGEGIVNLLGIALDGAGSLRTVDSRAVFAVVASEGDFTPDPSRGGRVARQLGASLFVLGDIVQVGERLQIEATLYRAGDAVEPLDRAVISGDAEEVFELVDQLAARLLAGLGRPSTDRLLRTAATTASLPAFKA
jgi:TolB-like protein